MARRRSTRRGWGAIRRLPSGRWQASYVGPDTIRHTAPDTFDAQIDAEAWLAMIRGQIATGTWVSPDLEDDAPRPLTFGEYAAAWIEDRDLRPSTQRIYRHALDRYILPTFGARPLASIRPSDVSRWHASLRSATGPTQRAHSYSLLRTIFHSAVAEDVAEANPCRVPGAGQSKRASKTTTLNPAEIRALSEAVEPSLRAFVLVAGWCGLRIGELLELRRRDLDLEAGTLTVERQVHHATGKAPTVAVPKTAAGVRTVAIPSHVQASLREHLDKYARPGRDALVFPAADGGHRVPSTVRRSFKRAAAEIGHPELRVHDLRHTAATLAAQTGATVAELMARLGHTTPDAAIRYQHAARGRDAEIAARLSEMAGGGDGGN